MTINARCGAVAVHGIGKRGATAAIVLALAFGASGGAFAQCAGSYHSSSGAGSHGSAASSSSVHSGASSAHSVSSCASGSSARASRAANLASLHTAGFGQGGGHAWSHRTASHAVGVGKSGVDKKGVGSSVKP